MSKGNFSSGSSLNDRLFQFAGVGSDTPTIDIDNSKIIDSPFNAGLSSSKVTEIADSMKEFGLLEPIAVYDKGDGTYEIISGHMRRKAWCEILGHKKIAAIVLPYEQDAEKRFRIHTQANSTAREHDFSFWMSRIDAADKLFAEEGKKYSSGERMSRLTFLLGLSQPQIYRYEAFKNLIPELQQSVTDGWITINAVSPAGKFPAELQYLAYKKAAALREQKLKQNPSERGEVTRDEFRLIINELEGKAKETKEQKRAKAKGFSEKISLPMESAFKYMRKAKTEEEKAAVRECIRKVRDELEMIEKEL